MKKALLVAYHFPPVRVSSGIQRTLSLTRYLQGSGWMPVVLSASSRAYEHTCEDQLKDIPEGIRVSRAFGLDTSRHLAFKGRYWSLLALPDRWVSWWLGGVFSGLKLIRQEKPSVIWTTYPIATAHLIGLTLHRLTGLPWIADCRDSMTEDGYPSNRKQKGTYLWIERQAIKHAAKMIFTTPGARKMYRQRYPQANPDNLLVIPNGYDEDIFRAVEAGLKSDTVASPQPLTLVHSGVLYPSERDPRPFFDALAELKTEGAIDSSQLRVVLRATAHDHLFLPMLDERNITDLVFLEPGVSYAEALAEMLAADALLLFQAANCNHQIPAKVYEYFRAAKPVLSLTDAAGDTAATLREAKLDTIVDLADKASIKTGLIDFIDQLRAGTAPIADSQVAQKYSRQSLTAEFASVFDIVSNK